MLQSLRMDRLGRERLIPWKGTGMMKPELMKEQGNLSFRKMTIMVLPFEQLEKYSTKLRK